MHEFDKYSGWFHSIQMRLFTGKPPSRGTEFGCSALPNFENEFQANFQRTLEYAKALNCKKWVLKWTPFNWIFISDFHFGSHLANPGSILWLVRHRHRIRLKMMKPISGERIVNAQMRKPPTSTTIVIYVIFSLSLFSFSITFRWWNFNFRGSNIGHVEICNMPAIYWNLLASSEWLSRSIITVFPVTIWTATKKVRYKFMLITENERVK